MATKIQLVIGLCLIGFIGIIRIRAYDDEDETIPPAASNEEDPKEAAKQLSAMCKETADKPRRKREVVLDESNIATEPRTSIIARLKETTVSWRKETLMDLQSVGSSNQEAKEHDFESSTFVQAVFADVWLYFALPIAIAMICLYFLFHLQCLHEMLQSIGTVETTD